MRMDSLFIFVCAVLQQLEFSLFVLGISLVFVLKRMTRTECYVCALTSYTRPLHCIFEDTMVFIVMDLVDNKTTLKVSCDLFPWVPCDFRFFC